MDSFKNTIERQKKTQQPTVHFNEVLPTIEQTITLLIKEAEKRADGNQTIMSEMLGISRPALNKRLQKLKGRKDL